MGHEPIWAACTLCGKALSAMGVYYPVCTDCVIRLNNERADSIGPGDRVRFINPQEYVTGERYRDGVVLETEMVESEHGPYKVARIDSSGQVYVVDVRGLSVIEQATRSNQP